MDEIGCIDVIGHVKEIWACERWFFSFMNVISCMSYLSSSMTSIYGHFTLQILNICHIKKLDRSIWAFWLKDVQRNIGPSFWIFCYMAYCLLCSNVYYVLLSWWVHDNNNERFACPHHSLILVQIKLILHGNG